MDPILDKARAGQNWLEKLVNMIPGFSGYREKELRREADALQREHLAKLLEQCKRPLNDAAAALSRTDLDAINDVETAKKRLDKAIARVRHADRGYGGFFDAVKVDEAMLDRVYQFDLALLESVEAIRARAGELRDRQALVALIGAIDAIDNQLNEREALLSGAK
jgi:hypothetical protein